MTRRTGPCAMLAAMVVWLIAAAGPSGAEAPPEFGWLGISIAEVGEELADRLATTFGPEAGTGVLVADVLKGGPAEQAGFRRGDVIVRLDAQPIWEVRQLQRAIRSRAIQQRVMVTLLREAARITLPVTIGAMPASARAQLSGEPFGFLVREEDPGEARRPPPAPAGRVFVAFVDQGSPASRAGLHPQDVILRINDVPVQGLEEFDQAMRRARGTVSLLVERRGASGPLTLTLEAARH